MSLLLVHINPEMRVKLERGLSPARLTPGQPCGFIVEVENAARTTAPLRLSTAQRDDGSGHRDRWLQLDWSGPLTGAPTQTLVLTLVTGEIGYREAIFTADIGQGTQDLGFRAELAILFHCEEALR